MKKTLLALAVVAMCGSAFATNLNLTGVSSKTGSASAGVKTSSVAGAASAGNGTAFTATGGYQFSATTLDKSASTGYTGSIWNPSSIKLTGDASVEGTAETAGGAYSYTKTSGTGIAGSLTIGEACADVEAAAGFLTANGAVGLAAGQATSRGANVAGTASVGTGEAFKGNQTANFSAFSADATASKALFGNNNTVTSAATAQSDSVKTLGYGTNANFTSGNAIGFQTSLNFGAAGSLANAQAGNLCSGCSPVVLTPHDDDDKKSKKNNGFGNGDQGAPGNSGPHNNAENGPRGNRN